MRPIRASPACPQSEYQLRKEAFEVVKDEKIDAIPNSGNKFMTLSIGNLKFMDSFFSLWHSAQRDSQIA